MVLIRTANIKNSLIHMDRTQSILLYDPRYTTSFGIGYAADSIAMSMNSSDLEVDVFSLFSDFLSLTSSLVWQEYVNFPNINSNTLFANMILHICGRGRIYVLFNRQKNMEKS